MKKIFQLIILFGMMISPVFATEPKPFSCTSESFVSFNTVSGAGNGDSKFNTISLLDGTLSSEKVVTGVNGVNSIGYNVKDNMVWGYNIGSDKVVRIDANKNSTLYDVTGLDKRFYVAADVDKNGILYLFSRGNATERKHLARVDLNTMKVLPEVELVYEEVTTIAREINTADFAFNPQNGKLYFIQDDTDTLYSISFIDDGKKGVVHKEGSLEVGAISPIINFFDKDGNFYFNINTTTMYKVNVATSSKATWFSKLDNSLRNGDGARCANASVEETANPTLIADYHFDECTWAGTAGEVKDSSGNGFDGVSVGVSKRTDVNGTVNRSGKFVSDDASVRVENITGLDSNNFSLSFWTKIKTTGWAHELIQVGNGTSDSNWGVLELRYSQSDHKMYLSVDHANGNTYQQDIVVDLNDEAWHHVALTNENGIIKLHIDNTLYTFPNSFGTRIPFDGVLKIGDADHNFYTQTEMDEVKLYNKILTDSEIGTIYDNEKSGKNADGTNRAADSCPLINTSVEVIAEYRLDECAWDGTVGEVKDSSGHGFDGKAQSTANTDNVAGQVGGSGKFVGDYDAVSVENITGLDSNNFAISFWTKIDTNSSSTIHELIKLGNVNEGDVNNGDSGIIEIRYNTDSKEFRVGTQYIKPDGSRNGNSQIATVDMTDGKWHHIVYMYHDEYLQAYVDNQELDFIHYDGSTGGISHSWHMTPFDGKLYLGNFLNGVFSTKVDLDEVKLYNGILDIAKISEIYTNEKAHKNADGTTREAVTCLDAFTCDDTMYFSNAYDLTTDTKESGKMFLHSINREQSPFSFSKIGEGYTKQYNALAYNPADDFLYATYKNELLKIDKNGVVQSLGIIKDASGVELEDKQYFSATFGHIVDGKAYYYLTQMHENKIYKIDVTTAKIVQVIETPRVIYTVDMTIDESGENIYYMHRIYDTDPNQLVKYNIANNTFTDIGKSVQNNSLVSSIYCDSTGRLFMILDEGGFYEIDPATGKQMPISDAPQMAYLNDGAMCPNATVHLKPTITIGDAQVTEGDSGTTNLVFPITYANGDDTSIDAVTFDYATKDGNDSNDQVNATSTDYESVSANGHVESITVPVKGDLLVEADEKLFMVLSNMQGALYHDSNLVATGTIVDNDVEQNAFTCDVNSFIFTSHSDDDFTKALNVNFMDDKIETLREEFNIKSAENIRGSHINAIGYNVQDNYIYGWEFDAAGCADWSCSERAEGTYNPGVVRIDKDFNIKRIAISGFTEKRALYAGDISLEGKYYLSGSKEASDTTVTATNEIFVIDLKNQVLEETLTLSEDIKMADFAFCPTDNKIYTTAKREVGRKVYYDLIRIDPHVKDKDSGKVIVERLGNILNSDDNLSNGYTNITFFDKSGNFYFYASSNSQKSVYKIDISNPDDINTTAVLYKDIELSSGDGARCSLAPIENVYELNVTNSSALEGNSGYNDMNFTITLDREVFEESGLPINYTLTSGSEIIDADKNSGTFTIPKGTKVYTLVLPVIKGDIVVEENKDFHMHLSIDRDASYTDKEVMTVDAHKVEIKFLTADAEGLVIDDDYNTLTAFDVGDTVDRKIETKIVNGSFTLEIAPIASDGSISDFEDMNDTKIKIVDSSACVTDANALTDRTGFVPYDVTKSPREETISVPKAMKSAKVQFWWKNKFGEQASCSGDVFAVRPHHFGIEIEPKSPDTTLKAGKEFTIKIMAKDAAGATITNYNTVEDNKIEYVLDHNDTKVNTNINCIAGTFTPENAASTPFENGIATIDNAKYTEVGKLDFKVHEVEGAWYASVDSADTEDAQRKIGDGVSVSKEFGIAQMQITSTFTNGGVGIGTENYTYFADSGDMKDMAATYETTVTVKGGDNALLKNFTKECYAVDVPIKFSYEVGSSSPVAPVIDNNGTIYPQSEIEPYTWVTYDFNISKDAFSEGAGSTSLKINFDREKNVAKNPLTFEVVEAKARLDGVVENAMPTNNTMTTFIYIRANVPSPQNFTGRDGNITVNYEVYCDEDEGCDRNQYPGLKNLVESEDAIRWYTLEGFTEAAGMTPTLDFQNPKALFSTASLYDSFEGVKNISGPSSATPAHTSPTLMNITVTGGLPHKDKIAYEPKYGYLIFNLFNPAATTHTFKMRAMPETQTWSGKGDLGMTVDNNTAVGNGLQKVDW